ncbi:hypothetical protein JL108_04210 [Aeromicrobium sp. YIM 150415]|uniref:SCO7613 C-terminal domain-containing membrane protein n=1 Tax=Aeromicrobium sp. YIM 150415 TaxID=2803912 RepID=UPI001964579E|nr:hypothetical protein [Aeromicrobium sp. YIM 150415]MBM9462642.1 hypothetical protein [Aeromicrobium sp. YIM 150415]
MTAASLWERLQDADRLIARSRESAAPRQGTSPSAPAGTPAASAAQGTPPPGPPPFPPFAGPQAPGAGPSSSTGPTSGAFPQFPGQPTASAPTKRSGVNVGGVILALGALLLLVAATIFITVSWDRLGLFGRSMVLLGVTVLAAAGASELSRRRLRGSAEALWCVTLGLLTLDWFAARAQGLLGLESVDPGLYVGAWSVVVSTIAIVIVVATRSRFGKSLVVPQVVAALTPWVAVPTLLFYLWFDLDWRPFWAGLAAVSVAGIVAVLAWRTRATVATWGVAPPLVVMLPFLVVSAAVDALAHPEPRQLLLDAHGVPLLLISVLFAVGALTAPRGRSVTAAGALLGVTLLLATGVGGATVPEAAIATAAVVGVLTALLGSGTRTWALGSRWTAAVLAVAGLGLVVLGWLQAWPRNVYGPWSGSLPEPFGLGVLAYATAAAAVIVAVVVSARWSTDLLAVIRYAVLSVAVACGLGVTLAALGASFGWFVVAGVVAAAVVACAAARRPVVDQIGTVLVLVGMAFPSEASNEIVFAAFGIVALAALIVVALAREIPSVAVSSAAVVLGVVASGSGLVGWQRIDPSIAALFFVLVAIVCFALATWGVEELPVRLTLEVAAAVVAFYGLVVGLDAEDATWMALLFLLLSLVLFGAGFDVADRRWCLIPAVTFAVLAWICLVIGQEVQAVEAFTVPLAVLALGIGGWFMWRDSSLGTVPALGVGLAVAFLPSMPQALADPTSLRAWLLGAAAVVAIGVGWWRSWRAPFVAGAVVLAVLVVVNLWPVAMAVQRWILFGVLGLALLAIGITWESRVRQGRAVLRALSALR